jgi:RNA recognition motif-containing protein
MPVRLFVGNLPYNATDAELRAHFSAAGPVAYLSLPTDRETGTLRGFAFVEYNESAQADEAIRLFNNELFKGRPLSVSIARAREDRPPGDRPARPMAPRPMMSRPATDGGGMDTRPPAGGGKPSRDFGPDAAPQGRSNNKKKTGARPERPQRGPMREMVRGRFFGGADDVDGPDDELDDDLDLYEDEDDDLYDDDDDNLDLADKAENYNEKPLTNRLGDATGEGN